MGQIHKDLLIYVWYSVSFYQFYCSNEQARQLGITGWEGLEAVW